MTSEDAGSSKPIEILPPLVTKHWETDGGPIAIYRLKSLTSQQIAEHGLEKYAAPLGGEEDAE